MNLYISDGINKFFSRSIRAITSKWSLIYVQQLQHKDMELENIFLHLIFTFNVATDWENADDYENFYSTIPLAIVVFYRFYMFRPVTTRCILWEVTCHLSSSLRKAKGKKANEVVNHFHDIFSYRSHKWKDIKTSLLKEVRV